MFRDILNNRLFIGALAFFVFCVGGSLLYQWHVLEETKREFDHIGEGVLKAKEPPKPKVRTPVLPARYQEEQPGSEVAPVAPVTRPVNDTRNSDIKWKDASEQRQYNNPHPFENVPVDLWDFEATKAAMIENINFVKANWDPKVYNKQVSIASAISENIANATNLPIYTPEEAEELRALHLQLLEFKGIESGRVSQLKREGHTNAEAIRIAAEETLQRWGVK